MSEFGRLQINLLGKPEVWLDGALLTNFSTAETEALLYYLAATEQAHSRETLAGLLWADMPEAKARRNLTKSLSVLRRLLGPFLLIEPQRVGFSSDVCFELDIRQLGADASISSEQVVSTPDLTSEAITRYRGDFLEGFFVKDALAFEEWQLTQREHWRETAISILETLVEQAAHQREYALRVGYARRLLELNPWHESGHSQLMLLLARQGQLAAALAQYEQCRQILANELGVEPLPATTALHQRIREARHKHSYSLPHEATPLVGREQELAYIQQRLSHPDCRSLTITGLGGMGKTRLAVAAAHQVNQEAALSFLSGIAFVSLAGVAATAVVPLALAKTLDVPLSSAAMPRQSLLNFLHNREMLLVLDNMEHLPGASELLLEILQTCPDVKLLITSREPLNLAAEWRLDLEGLPFPPAEENDETKIRAYAAVTLFSRSAAQMEPQFRLSAENAPDISQLCRLVAGIPLALQLAAAWLPVMSISSILAALKQDLDILATDMQDIPPRQSSIRAVLDSAWQLLSTKEQRALAALSICRGGFTQITASAIADTNPFLLRRLINRALIYQQGETRFDMHPLTRQFAREKLRQAANEEMAIERHGRYFLSWLIDQAQALQGMAPQGVIKAIEEELDNLRQAWGWAVQRKQIALLGGSLAVLATFYDKLGLLQEGQTLAESILSAWGEAANSDEEHFLCRALIRKSHFLMAQGQYEAAASALDGAQVLAQRLPDQEMVADVNHIRGLVLTDTGQYSEAKQLYGQALTIYRRLQNERKTAQTLTDLGWTHIVDGDVDAALPLLQEALAIERKIGHKWGEAFALGNLSIAFSMLGEQQTALENQQKVLEAYEDLGDLLNIERTENNIGMNLLGIGRYREALPHIQRAVELARVLGSHSSLANALDSLGTVYLACGEYGKARVCLEEALESALAIGYVYIDYSVRAVLTRLFNRTGQLTQAGEHLQQLRSLVERLENAIYVARSLAEEAYLSAAQGNLDDAVGVIVQAIDILRENPAPLDLPYILLQYADFLEKLQRPAEALPFTLEAIETAVQLQHKPLQLHGRALAAFLSHMVGEIEAAQRYEEEVRRLLVQLEPYPDVLSGLLYLGRYHLAVGDRQRAAKISAFIANHPAGAFVVRREAQLFLDEIGGFSLEPVTWDELVAYLAGDAR